LRSPFAGISSGHRKECRLASFLQVGYTPEAWANLVANPHDRIADVRPVVEKLGGKLVKGWFAFGDCDIVSIVEMPSNVEAAAFWLVAAAGAQFVASRRRRY
jgi:uncharacterized protein with GYD domain